MDGDFQSVIDLQALFALPYALTQAHTWLGGILLNHISLICMMKSNAEHQNIAAELLYVSMKPGSRDKVSLMWMDIAFMHNNLFSVLQVSVSNLFD